MNDDAGLNFLQSPRLFMRRLRKLLTNAARPGFPILIMVTSLACFVPFMPAFPTNSVDSAWAYGMNMAVAKGLVFGRDIIFTYGPYATVFTELYHPATDTQMLWSTGLLALAFAASLICLTRGPYRGVALCLALFVMLIPRDAQLLTIPFVSLLLMCRMAMRAGDRARIVLGKAAILVLSLATVALSLLTLVKGTFAIACLMVIVPGCVLHFVCGQRWLAIGIACLFIFAMAALWCVAGQPLSALPRFFVTQLPVISGYGAAMSTPNVAWQIPFFLVSCLALGLLAAWSLAGTGRAGAVLMAGSTIVIFMAFKEGFVRDNGHHYVAGGLLGVAGWAVMLGRNGRISKAALIVGLTAWAIINLPGLGVTGSMFVAGQVGKIISLVIRPISSDFFWASRGLVERLTNPAEIPVVYDYAVLAIRRGQPIPHLSGTTDAYSFGQSALFANELDWNPRPLVQSYTAYTSWLEEQDVRHIEGPDAPANILFTPEPIDGRLAALEDGASWPVLLTRYEITGYLEDWAFLTKRPPGDIGNPISSQPILAGIFHLGQQITLPPDALMVWAKVNVTQTLLGKLVGLVFKPPPLEISYIFQDGTSKTFRYIAGFGPSGFLAAPVVQTTPDFINLALPNPAQYFAGHRPVSFSIEAKHGSGQLWNSRFTAAFYAMHIPVQPDAENLVFSPLTSTKLASYARIVPGAEIVQRFTPLHNIDGVNLSVVAWGRSPSPYTINWRLDGIVGGQNLELGAGQLDAQKLTDWQGVELAFSSIPAGPLGQVKVTVWTDAKADPPNAIGLPLFVPAPGNTDPPAEINGVPAPGGGQFDLTPYFVK